MKSCSGSRVHLQERNRRPSAKPRLGRALGGWPRQTQWISRRCMRLQSVRLCLGCVMCWIRCVGLPRLSLRLLSLLLPLDRRIRSRTLWRPSVPYPSNYSRSRSGRRLIISPLTATYTVSIAHRQQMFRIIDLQHDIIVYPRSTLIATPLTQRLSLFLPPIQQRYPLQASICPRLPFHVCPALQFLLVR